MNTEFWQFVSDAQNDTVESQNYNEIHMQANTIYSNIIHKIKAYILSRCMGILNKSVCSEVLHVCCV